MIRRRVLGQALRIWLLLLGFAVVNGLFRQRVLEPTLGPEPAHFLATTTLAGFVLLVSLFSFAPRERDFSPRELLAVGVLWASLTVLCELAIGLARGLPAAELFRDYDVTRGRLFALVVVSEAVSPLLAGSLGRLGR